MFAFIQWMIIGLFAGLLARLLVPGRQPMGLVMTMLLGMVGALVGGYVSSVFFGYGPHDPRIHMGGLFIATGGAMLILVIAAAVGRSNNQYGDRP